MAYSHRHLDVGPAELATVSRWPSLAGFTATMIAELGHAEPNISHLVMKPATAGLTPGPTIATLTEESTVSKGSRLSRWVGRLRDAAKHDLARRCTQVSALSLDPSLRYWQQRGEEKGPPRKTAQAFDFYPSSTSFLRLESPGRSAEDRGMPRVNGELRQQNKAHQMMVDISNRPGSSDHPHPGPED